MCFKNWVYVEPYKSLWMICYFTMLHRVLVMQRMLLIIKRSGLRTEAWPGHKGCICRKSDKTCRRHAAAFSLIHYCKKGLDDFWFIAGGSTGNLRFKIKHKFIYSSSLEWRNMSRNLHKCMVLKVYSSLFVCNLDLIHRICKGSVITTR